MPAIRELSALCYPGAEIVTRSDFYGGGLDLITLQTPDDFDRVRKWYGNARRLGTGISRGCMWRSLTPREVAARHVYPPPEVYNQAGDAYEAAWLVDVTTLHYDEKILTLVISGSPTGTCTVILLQLISLDAPLLPAWYAMHAKPVEPAGSE